MRIDYVEIEPDFIRRFRELTRDLSQLAIDPVTRALVELRVSQINGCAYCIVLHQAEARKLGVSSERLAAVAEWSQHAFFNDRERAAFRWAEALTQTGRIHNDENEFDALRAQFSEREVVALGLVISTANFWNRMAGGFRKQSIQKAV